MDVAKEGLKKQVIYPGFNTRIVAGLIDLLIATIVLSPVMKLIQDIIFGNDTQSRMIIKLAEEVKNKNTKIGLMELLNHPIVYEYYLTNHGLLKLSIEMLLQFLIYAAVIITFWYYRQATPGKMLLSTKIVDANTFDKPSLSQLIIRFLSYPISMFVLCLGFISIMFNKQGLSWHDKISGTLVIKK